MTSTHLRPFQRHLTYFAVPPARERITFLSALRAALALGLNLPFSLGIALSMRFYWAQSLLRPVHIPSIPPGPEPCHLQFAQLIQSSYTPGELLKLYYDSPYRRAGFGGWMDKTHIESFANWTKGSDGRVKREHVERYQTGDWQGIVTPLRKGRDHVVPPKYGGPIIVWAHSWFVRVVFGVRVYEARP